MASFNRVILVGNVTRDIELKYTQGGTAVTELGLAVNDRRKSQSGEWVEETTFVDVTLWGRTAEVASEYLSKGSPVLIEGRLKYDTWETDGQKKSKLRVVGERMQMLGGRGGGGGGNSGGGHAAESSANTPHSANVGNTTASNATANSGATNSGGNSGSTPDDEIPF